LIYFELIYLS